MASDPLVAGVDPLFLSPDGVARPEPQPGDRPEREAFTARVIPGMERVSSLASSDAASCALTDDKPPVCVTLGEPPRFVPGPSEPLRKWMVAEGVDCRLSMKNKLDCFGASTLSMTSVRDFVLAAGLELYTLAPGGTVTLTELSRQGQPRTRSAVFRNAVEIQELAGSAACARTSGGQVSCTRVSAAFDAPVQALRDASGVTHFAPGFARDGSATLFEIGEFGIGREEHALLALRLGSGIVELATVGLPGREACVLLSAGDVRCRPTRRGEADERVPSTVALPGRAKRFHPASAPCVELQNGTVACWGPDVERLERLGLRVLELSPGAIQPR